MNSGMGARLSAGAPTPESGARRTMLLTRAVVRGRRTRYGPDGPDTVIASGPAEEAHHGSEPVPLASPCGPLRGPRRDPPRDGPHVVARGVHRDERGDEDRVRRHARQRLHG